METIDLNARISLLIRLGERLNHFHRLLETSEDEESMLFNALLASVGTKNPWFTRQSVGMALKAWADALDATSVQEWAGRYPALKDAPVAPRVVGVINAGNIPFVGLHDLLSVLLSGHIYKGKNASDDPYLLPWIADELKRMEPAIQDRISFVDKLSDIEAVIATGSNNSARYFEYYFGKYPNIIRKNRNAIAVLDGNETAEDLNLLGRDIFSYFGLGCRNVAKLYVPRNYTFDRFFEAVFSYADVMQHNKYMNNFEYHQAVFLLKQIPFLQNNFLILKEDEAISSPLAVLHYERYDDSTALSKKLVLAQENLQCIVTGVEKMKELRMNPGIKTGLVPFGKAQSPELWDYADAVDTIQFLTGLR